MDKQLLIDTLSFRAQVLEDNSHSGGKIIARGEFARADLATENKRVYPKALWERELGRLAKQIQERKVYGELDHPMDGRTQLKRASHIITDLRLENNTVIGTAEIMNTAEGKNLKAILEAGGQVGVSSRGFGTTRPNLKGEDVVNDDYRLMTFDFVAEPANTTSYPTIHAESKGNEKVTTRPRVEASMGISEDTTLENLRKSNPKLYENFMQDAEREFEKRGAEIWAKKIQSAKQEAATDLRAQFAEQLEQAIADAKKAIADTEREKLLHDPTVAGAKHALESLKQVLRPYVIPEDVESVVKEKEAVIETLTKKVANQELEMVKLREENEKLAGIAREAGYRFHVEKLISGNPHADVIRKMVGDVKQFESVGQVNARVVEIVEELQSQVVKQEERDVEMAKLREENETLRKATEKALEAAKYIGIQTYIEQRLANHPRADVVRQLIEAKQPDSKEAVDQIVSSVRESRRDPEAIEQARARVRQLAGASGAREYIQEHEERGSNNGNAKNGAAQDFNGLGVDISTLRRLSGTE